MVPVNEEVAARSGRLAEEMASNPVVQQLRLLDDRYLELQESCRVELRKLKLAHEERCQPLRERRRRRLAIPEPEAGGLGGGSSSSSSTAPAAPAAGIANGLPTQVTSNNGDNVSAVAVNDALSGSASYTAASAAARACTTAVSGDSLSQSEGSLAPTAMNGCSQRQPPSSWPPGAAPAPLNGAAPRSSSTAAAHPAASKGGASSGPGKQAPPPCLATPAVPGFWRLVLQNSTEFQDIEEYDEPVLDYLDDIVCESLDESGRTGFRMRMQFVPNPFFSNEELVKTYHTERKNPFVDVEADTLECTRIQSSKIEWLSGKNVTVEIVTRKVKSGGRKKQAKPKREEVARPSFFRTFFRNLGPLEELPEEELDDRDEDEDHADIMEELIQEDYDRALALREWLVPHAVRWYTGDACDDDDDDEEEEEEEEEEDHEDESSRSRMVDCQGQ